MKRFETHDWHTLDMETKIRLFSQMFPMRLSKRTRLPNRGLGEVPFLPMIYTSFGTPPKLERYETSMGGWVEERPCPDAPVKRRVTFEFPDPLVMLQEVPEPPPWHLERHDTSIGGWVAERV